MRCRIIIICLLLVFNGITQAEVYSTIDSNNKILYCNYDDTSGAILAGRLKRSEQFISYTELLKKARKKLRLQKSNRASAIVLRKLKNKLKKLKNKKNEGAELCQTARDLPPGAPTPTPTPSCTGNFDVDGNTCPNKFGIPSELTGNISNGSQIQQLRCTGCHIERTFYDYPSVLHAVQTVPDMNGILNGYDMQQAIADLVAYFNRFDNGAE